MLGDRIWVKIVLIQGQPLKVQTLIMNQPTCYRITKKLSVNINILYNPTLFCLINPLSSLVVTKMSHSHFRKCRKCHTFVAIFISGAFLSRKCRITKDTMKKLDTTPKTC
jgi:hypothetical protein